MNSALVKEELRNAIDWRVTFPGFVFRDTSFRFAYFFETSWIGRRDIGTELDRLLIRGATDDAVISVENENDGGYEEGRVEVTTWQSNDGKLFSANRLREYFESEPAWPGFTVAAGDSMGWVLYENPAEPFGVFVTRQSLQDLRPDPDIIFDVPRVCELAARPSAGLHAWVPERIASSYGAMI